MSGYNLQSKKALPRLRLLAFQFLSDLARDDSGQATVEYILLVSFAVLGAGLMSRGILHALDLGVLNLGKNLEDNLHTGRIPAHAFWAN